MFKLSTDISKKDRKVATLQDFKGLDTVHSPLNITYSHAIGMRNIINRDGANRKRKGWRQTKAFDAAGTPAGSWSGELDFSADKDGSDKKNVFIHFYYLNNSLEIKAYDLADDSEITVEKDFTIQNIQLKEIQTVFFENKLYSVGAGELLIGSFSKNENQYKISFNDISNEKDFTIPNTINLGKNTINYSETGIVPIEELYLWEEVAVNYCRTDNYYAPNEEYPEGENTNSTRLDGITPFTIQNDSIIKLSSSEVVGDINVFSDKVTNIARINLESEDFEINKNGISKIAAFRLDQMEGYSTEYGSYDTNANNKYFSARSSYMKNIVVDVYINDQKQEQLSYTKFTQNDYKVDDVTPYAIFDPYVYPVSDDIRIAFVGKNFVVDMNKLMQYLENNFANAYAVSFKITFKHRQSEASLSYINKIKNATMLTLFGAEGTPNRLLFCDGSNTMLYSEYRDPFYVSEENTITLGNTPITAWIKGTETSLYVFKKFSRQEENLYVIDPQLVTSSNNVYNVNKGEVLYLHKGYSVPESAVNQYCACNLANDILIVSNDGVYGIEMSANVASTERFARSRAEQIKNLLQEEDLTSAKAIVWDNKMFISVNGNVYIADARYRATFNGDMSDTFNYEWWFWDNMPVYYWIIINEKLCFVTSDNRICEFYEGFIDTLHDNVSVTAIDDVGVTISKDYAEYNKVQFNGAHKEYINPSDIQGRGNGLIIRDFSKLFTEINEGDIVYFDYVTEKPNVAIPTDNTEVNTQYIVSEIDLETKEVRFQTLSGDSVNFLSLPFGYSEYIRVSKIADKKYNMVIDPDAADGASNTTVKDNDGKTVSLIAYNGVNTYTATVYKENPVVAVWKTGSYDFGSSLNAKSIERFSISFDRSSSKKLKLYYTTANMGFPNLIKDLKKQNDFDLTNLNFLLFSFDQKFETSYTKNVLIRNFNYISFMLVSDDAEDFAINSISFVYKINRINRGEL